MNRASVIDTLIQNRRVPCMQDATAFAPVNIALIKYWGKRNTELMLPMTDSISIAFQEGTTTTIRLSSSDSVMLNGHQMERHSIFYQRLFAFLNEVRSPGCCCAIETYNALATGAGLASSASGFAALVRTCNQFFGWNLGPSSLSILARLCSGSSCRSLFPGFVRWAKGEQDDGMDSFAYPLSYTWPELRCGVIMVNEQEKAISSSWAMQHTVETSSLYRIWPCVVEEDCVSMQSALEKHDFTLFGTTMERNACAMHAMMHTASPPISYWLPETVKYLSDIWQARAQGLEVYATMDAGPNIKLFFQEKDVQSMAIRFPMMRTIALG